MKVLRSTRKPNRYRRGQTGVEYALILAAIGLLVLSGFRILVRGSQTMLWAATQSSSAQSVSAQSGASNVDLQDSQTDKNHSPSMTGK